MGQLVREDQPLYTISIVSELLGVHPETLRVWERNNLIKPARQNKQRLYSNNDLKRLKFIIHLTKDRGLNVAGVRQLLDFYPCWLKEQCVGGRAKETINPGEPVKYCWKYEGCYCGAADDGREPCDCCLTCPEYASCQRVST